MKNYLAKLIILPAALALSACTVGNHNSNTTIYDIKRSNFQVTVVEQPSKLADNVLGSATYLPASNHCVIILRQYPICLLHEIRHCLEGNWHEGRTSDEDC